MARKNKLIHIALLASLFTFSISSCKLTDNESKSTEVKKLDLSGVVFEDASVSYDGKPHSIFAKNVPSGISVTYENNGAILLGSHRIVAHFSKKTSGTSASERYEEVVKIAYLTITKDATSIDETLSEKLDRLVFPDMNVTYTGSQYTVKLQNPEDIPSGFTAIYSNNVQVAAGEYVATCKIVKSDTMVAYKTLSSKIIIAKAEIDIKDVVFKDTSYPSDGKIHIIEPTNVPDKVTYRYELVSSTTGDNLDANAIINVGSKTVRAVFSVDPASGLDASNYTIVNSADADRTNNKKTATISILQAGALQYTVKYIVRHYEESLNSDNSITRIPKYDLDNDGNEVVYSQNIINTNFGNYIKKSNLVEREGYEIVVRDEKYNDILTEDGFLVGEGATGGDIIVEYVPIIYNVDFNVEHGQINSRTYTIEESLNLLDPNLDDSHRFVGWYTDSGYSIPVSTLKGLTGNRVIYGRAIEDDELFTFTVKNTTTIWDGNGKSIEVSGLYSENDIAVKYEYYGFDSNGMQYQLNAQDENVRPTEVGKYIVKVRFFTKKIDQSTGMSYVTNEERYKAINAYLIIEPKNVDSESNANFKNTTFEWTGNASTGNYPVLTNYPQSATDLTYAYYDSNMKALGSSKPTEPGTYYSYASYKLQDGTQEGLTKTFKATFTITKKSYTLDFINNVIAKVVNTTYEIKGDKVAIRPEGGNEVEENLKNYETSGFYLKNLEFGGTFVVGGGVTCTATRVDSNTLKFVFSNNAYPTLLLKLNNNKIAYNDFGTVEVAGHYAFEQEVNAEHYLLPASIYRTLTAYTTGTNKVTFKNADGAVISTVSVKTGSSVAAPSTSDYTLPAPGLNINAKDYEIYWKSDNKFSSLDKIMGDTVFTLSTRLKEYTLRFEVDPDSIGTIERIGDQKFTATSTGQFYNINTDNLVKSGYNFAGFYMYDVNGNRVTIESSSKFSDASKKLTSDGSCSNYVVYMQTVALTTTGIFDANGGTLNGNRELTQTFGKPYNLPTINPTIEGGYVFLGWSLNGSIIASNTIYSQYTTKALNFKAEYSKPTNTVTFLPENGDEFTSFDITIGEEIPMPLVSPKKSGYIFTGWYSSDGVKLEKGNKFLGSTSIVYSARYEAINVTIKYHNNELGKQNVDETIEILTTVSGTYGGKIPQATNQTGLIVYPPSLTGYTFLGWSLDGKNLITSDSLIDQFVSTTVDEELVYSLDIYPVYKNNNYKITYAFKVEGMLNKISNVIYNQNVDLETAPNRTGYYFDGWYTTSDCQAGTNFKDDILPNPSVPTVNANCYPYERDIVLYAKWVRKEYKVTFRYVKDGKNTDFTLPNRNAYGELLTSVGNSRTWLTKDEIYTNAGLNMSQALIPVFTYSNGSVVKEGDAFIYDPVVHEKEEADKNKVYDKENPDNNVVIIYIRSTINDFFNISYIADNEGLPTVQSVVGNADFNLALPPIREGKKFKSYYYYYKDADGSTKKYYLTDTGKADGIALTKWNISNANTAKNGVVDYVLYAEFEPLKYRLFIRTNDQQSLLGYNDDKSEKYVVTYFGEAYNISSNGYGTVFKTYVDNKLKELGYRFDYWRDNYGNVITTNTILTNPNAVDIDSSTNNTDGIYLYAQVKALNYIITYLPDNNSNPYVINVSYNAAYSKMGNPTKQGFRFSGWKYYKADKFNLDNYRNNTLPADALITDMNEISFNQTCDVIAIAQYVGDEYTITYKYNILKYENNAITVDTVESTSNVKYKDSYTVKSFTDFNLTAGNINNNYKLYLRLYEFVGWKDEQTLVIYKPGEEIPEYLKTADSSFVAVYTPREFTIQFTYVTQEKNTNTGTTISTTKVAKRENVALGDSIEAPKDPIPGGNTTYGDNKVWKPVINGNVSTDPNSGIDPLSTEVINISNIALDFYKNDADKTGMKNLWDAIVKLTDNTLSDFLVREYKLNASTNYGYYQIVLDNNDSWTLTGNTVYDVYGNLENNGGDRGTKIKLPNIVKTISDGGSFKKRQPGSTEADAVNVNFNRDLSTKYTYKMDDKTYKPYLRTVYVINGSYYLDGDYSPISITGNYDDPTTFYAFTTYLAGNSTASSYSELFNFTLKDEDGNPLKAHIVDNGMSTVDESTTLDSVNEIGFAGFMNREYTTTNLLANEVYIPYFYYDGIKIRRVTAIVNDSANNGAFENVTYAAKYYIPNSINFIDENSFLNTRTTVGANGVAGSDKIIVYYADSLSYFDTFVDVQDLAVIKNEIIMALNIDSMTYEYDKAADPFAGYSSHMRFDGRTHANMNHRSFATASSYTVLSYLNEVKGSSYTPWEEYVRRLYYSKNNTSRTITIYKGLNEALTYATDILKIKNSIMAFSSTADDYGSGLISEQENQKSTLYPYFMYIGTPISFARTYYSRQRINKLKIDDSEDLPVEDDGSKLYKDRPYYKIDKFYLAMPYKVGEEKQGEATINHTAKENIFVDSKNIANVKNLTAIYLETSKNIVSKLYGEDPNYFTDNGDPEESYSDSNFVTCYKSFTDSSDSITLDYLYNGDDEANGVTGAAYFIKTLIAGGEKADKLRENYKSKCVDFVFNSDGTVHTTNTKYSRFIATKNYQTKSIEYLFLGTYNDFLNLGKDTVDKYRGSTINFIYNENLKEYAEDDPLAIIDENSTLQRIFLGTSGEYLDTLSNDTITEQRNKNQFVYCFTSDDDYKLIGFYLGDVDHFLSTNLKDGMNNDVKKAGEIYQCLQTSNSTLQTIRYTSYIYLSDNASEGPTEFFSYKRKGWKYDTDNKKIVEGDEYNVSIKLYKGEDTIIYNAKVSDTTGDSLGAYYTNTAKVLATKVYDGSEGRVVAVLRQDFAKDSINENTTINSKNLELAYIGRLTAGNDAISNILNQKTKYGLDEVKHFAYYINNSLGSSIVYYFQLDASASISFNGKIYGSQDEKTYNDYFFNSNRVNAVNTNNGETPHYYVNVNMKQLLLDTSSLESDLQEEFKSNVIKAPYKYDGTSAFDISTFRNTYLGTVDEYIEALSGVLKLQVDAANGTISYDTSDEAQANINRLMPFDNIDAASNKFLFAKPAWTMSSVEAEDDMGLIYLNIDSYNTPSNENIKSLVDLYYSLQNNSNDNDKLYEVLKDENNKKRLISVVNLNLYLKSNNYNEDKAVLEDIYFYPFTVENGGYDLAYKCSDGSLTFSDNFIYFAGIADDFDKTKEIKSYVNYIGLATDILRYHKNYIYYKENSFYSLLNSTEVNTTGLSDKSMMSFYSGTPKMVEEDTNGFKLIGTNATASIQNDPFYEAHPQFAQLFIKSVNGELSTTNVELLHNIRRHSYVVLIDDMSADISTKSLSTTKTYALVDYISDSSVGALYDEFIFNNSGLTGLNATIGDKAKELITISGRNFFIIRGNDSSNGIFTQKGNNLSDYITTVDSNAVDNMGVPYYFNNNDQYKFDDATLYEIYRNKFILQAGYDSMSTEADITCRNVKLLFLGSASNYMQNATSDKFFTNDKLRSYMYPAAGTTYSRKFANLTNGTAWAGNTLAINYAEVSLDEDGKEILDDLKPGIGVTIKTLIPFLIRDTNESTPIWNQITMKISNRLSNAVLRLYSFLYETRFKYVTPYLTKEQQNFKIEHAGGLSPIVTVYLKDASTVAGVTQYTCDPKTGQMVTDNTDGTINGQYVENKLYIGRNVYMNNTVSETTGVETSTYGIKYEDIESFADGPDTEVDTSSITEGQTRFYYIPENERAIMLAKHTAYFPVTYYTRFYDQSSSTGGWHGTNMPITFGDTYFDSLAMFYNKELRNIDMSTLDTTTSEGKEEIEKLVSKGEILYAAYLNKVASYEQEHDLINNDGYGNADKTKFNNGLWDTSPFLLRNYYLPSKVNPNTGADSAKTRINSDSCVDWLGFVACRQSGDISVSVTDDSGTVTDTVVQHDVMAPSVIGISPFYSNKDALTDTWETEAADGTKTTHTKYIDIIGAFNFLSSGAFGLANKGTAHEYTNSASATDNTMGASHPLKIWKQYFIDTQQNQNLNNLYVRNRFMVYKYVSLFTYGNYTKSILYGNRIGLLDSYGTHGYTGVESIYRGVEYASKDATDELAVIYKHCGNTEVQYLLPLHTMDDKAGREAE